MLFHAKFMNFCVSRDSASTGTCLRSEQARQLGVEVPSWPAKPLDRTGTAPTRTSSRLWPAAARAFFTEFFQRDAAGLTKIADREGHPSRGVRGAKLRRKIRPRSLTHASSRSASSPPLRSTEAPPGDNPAEARPPRFPKHDGWFPQF